MMMNESGCLCAEPKQSKKTQLSTSFKFQLLLLPSHTMSNADWDTKKLVIGQKAKAPKVTKNAADLNGT